MTVNYWNVAGLVFDFFGVVGLAAIPELWGFQGIGRRILTGKARAAMLGSWGLVALGFVLQFIGQFRP
jgi:uncharacterized membrane protein YGL010W